MIFYYQASIVIPYKKITKKLVGPAIFLVRALQGGIKLATAFLNRLYRLVRWLVRPFLWRPLLKLYGQYLLSLKGVRDMQSNQEIRIAWLKRYAAPSLIALLTFIIAIYNLGLGSDNFNISEEMNQAVVASLITDEFGQNIGVTDYIKESAGDISNLKGNNDKYPTGAVESPINVYTNNEVPNTSESFSWLPYDYLFAPGRSTIGTVSDGSTGSSRNEIIQYTVAPGDSISSIAKKFGISVNTILWANNLSARSVIRQGNTLTILPQSGVMHKVARGESLQVIARKYGVDQDKIISANNLDGAGIIKIGQQLIVPGGQKTNTAVATSRPNTSIPKQSNGTKPNNAAVSGSAMQWPTVGYRITQYYSWRHTGLDIANKVGVPLYAAESGTVETAGWNSGGYGYQVVINHGGGRKTRYAHASKLYVVAGQKVARGETIAAMGSTGRSTGSHIHFEVIINGVRVNPLNYIK